MRQGRKGPTRAEPTPSGMVESCRRWRARRGALAYGDSALVVPRMASRRVCSSSNSSEASRRMRRISGKAAKHKRAQPHTSATEAA